MITDYPLEERLPEIARLEELANKLEEELKELERLSQTFTQATEKFETLLAYYQSPQWGIDYDASNEGLLPPPEEFPHGILSQDYLYNLIGDYVGIREEMEEVLLSSKRKESNSLG